jgi:hypothetical protein
MCEVPLDLQRKFERRWAARFVRPVREEKVRPQERGYQRGTNPKLEAVCRSTTDDLDVLDQPQRQ